MPTKIHCNKCGSITNHYILESRQETIEDSTSQEWQIIQCMGCDNYAFHLVKISDIGTDFELIEGQIFPEKKLRGYKIFDEIPAQIDQLYRETIDAYNGQMNVFCAGGLRALVEGICTNQGINDGPKIDRATGRQAIDRNGTPARCNNLDCRIEGLLENRLITPRQCTTLHEQRFLGNKALHELSRPDSESLNIAIDLIEHIMNEIYSLTSKTINLQGSGTRNQQQ